MTSPLTVAIRYYSRHRVTRAVVGIGLAGIITVGSLGFPAYADARTSAQEQLATLDVQIEGQLDAAESVKSKLGEQIKAAQALAEKAGVTGKLPEKNSLDALIAEITAAEKALAQLDKLATVAETAQSETDTDAWLPSTLTAERDELADHFQALRVQTLAATDIDLTPAADTVRSEMQAHAAAVAAEQEAAAAAMAAQEAEAAAQAEAEQTATETASYNGGGSGQPQQQPAAPAGAGRATAEALVAQLSGAPVVWKDLGVGGMSGAGQVLLFSAENVVYLSSGSDPAFWDSAAGRGVAAHEAAHILTNLRIDRLWPAGYTYASIADAAETGADCMAAMLGAPSYNYGCTPEGQKLANLILG